MQVLNFVSDSGVIIMTYVQQSFLCKQMTLKIMLGWSLQNHSVVIYHH